MSIASELTALANNRDAIKAAIEAKGVADAGDTLAEFPAAIASIPTGGGGAPETEPYPWVGTGTHAWLHYDSNSRSHTLTLRFSYTGTITIDWGDESPTTTVTNGNNTTTTQTHVYENGDWRLDITGDNPLNLGTYNESTGAVGAGTYGLLSDENGMSDDHLNPYPMYRDALVQFETDATAFCGNGALTRCIVGGTANRKWIKFTECKVFGNYPLGIATGLIGIYAPKLEYFYGGSMGKLPALRTMEVPSLVSFYQPKTTSSPATWFQYLVSMEEIVIPEGIAYLPANFMRYAFLLKSIVIPASVTAMGDFCLGDCWALETLTFASPPAGVTRTLDLGTGFGATSLVSVEIPEGVTTIAGEAFRESGLAQVILPSTLQSIPNSWAFYSLIQLKTLICRATTPPALGGSNVFKEHAANAKYYIPYGTTAAYTAAANWSQFSSLFVELNPDGTIPTT